MKGKTPRTYTIPSIGIFKMDPTFCITLLEIAPHHKLVLHININTFFTVCVCNTALDISELIRCPVCFWDRFWNPLLQSNGARTLDSAKTRDSLASWLLAKLVISVRVYSGQWASHRRGEDKCLDRSKIVPKSLPQTSLYVII